MAQPDTLPPPLPAALLERIEGILEHHHLMTVATLRSDGWPQATIVNYVADGLRLYFVVSSVSQKLVNLRHDRRASIAIGGGSGDTPVGLSLAVHVREVVEPNEIASVNDRLWSDGRGVGFRPHPATPGSVLLAADPLIVSLIDYDGPKAWPRLFRVEPDWRLVPVDPARDHPEILP
ncbi:MAG: pyridoxamine 5'-phosphate oxidase family protein [Caulobacter sp.]|nr:pyridoxamine 5'-phosphate oxidase family protein [Caulobacter sp.]